jgi:hypothetical protein
MQLLIQAVAGLVVVGRVTLVHLAVQVLLSFAIPGFNEVQAEQ